MNEEEEEGLFKADAVNEEDPERDRARDPRRRRRKKRRIWGIRRNCSLAIKIVLKASHGDGGGISRFESVLFVRILSVTMTLNVHSLCCRPA